MFTLTALLTRSQRLSTYHQSEKSNHAEIRLGLLKKNINWHGATDTGSGKLFTRQRDDTP